MSTVADITNESVVRLAQLLSEDTYLYAMRYTKDFKTRVESVYNFTDSQWREVERTIETSIDEENE